ncbi:MAG: DnaT-like ssDNA-binding protein [Pikeienuella sp.]
MALVVEDGTGVSGANSLVSVADAQAYAAARGRSELTNATTAEQLLLQAMDYLIGLESRFKGTRVNYNQALPFPRHGLTIDGEEWPSNTIPPLVVSTQIQLAIEEGQGDLNNPTAKNFVTEKTVHGAVTVKYATAPGVTAYARRTSDGMLAQFSASKGATQVVRA